MGNVSIVKGAAIGERGNSILYPTMLIAAIAVIVFSVIGIAAMTGLMPSAMSKNDSQPAAAPAKAAVPAVPAAPLAKSRTGAARPAAAARACADCGVVSSIRVVDAAAAPSGLGAVAGGVVGGILGNQAGRGRGRTAMTVVGAGAGAYAGHELEKNMHKDPAYEIRVRMEDGSHRTVVERSRPAFGVGQKVRITDAGIVAG